METRENNTLMDVIPVTGEKVSKKSTFSLCQNPLTMSHALYFSTMPSGFNFFLRIHLQPIVLHPGGKSTKGQVLYDSRDSISSSIASCHYLTSTDDKASWMVQESSSTI